MQNLAKSAPIFLFTVLTVLISWPPLILYAAGQSGLTSVSIPFLVLVLYVQFGPSLAGLILILLRSGWRGVMDLMKSLVRVRFSGGMHVFILLLYPALILVAALILSIRGEAMTLVPDFSPAGVITTFAVTTLLGLIFGGLSEEIGWRGFLQPQLEARMPWPVAAMLVGVVWSLWHLDPDAVTRLFTDGPAAFWQDWSSIMVRRLAETVPFAVLMAWVWRKTGFSLFAMLVMHSASNAALSSLPGVWEGRPDLFGYLIYGQLAVLAILVLFAGPRRKRPVEPA